MKHTKLLGIALIAVGLLTLGWIATVVFITKGMLVIFYGLIPLVLGWLLFHGANKDNSPNENTENKAGWLGEIKAGFARIRSYLKGLL